MKTDQLGKRGYQSSFKTQPTEFALTLLPDARLSRRLFAEGQFVTQQLRQSWPKFKEDPVRSVATAASEIAVAARRTVARPQMAIALATSVVLVTLIIVGVGRLERHAADQRADAGTDRLEVITTVDLTSDEAAKDRGAGARREGTRRI